MAAPAGTACTNHPKRDRVASCGNCGKPLCRDCVVHTPVGIKCPASTGGPVPAAASADRLSQDLNYSRPGTPDYLLRDLNDNFLAADMVTLRYDKRGGGTSHLQSNQALSYDDVVADAKAGLDFLAQRKETASLPLAVVGVDQGGLIAMRLASDPRVKAVALVSTFGRPLADVIGDDLLASRGDRGPAESEQVHAVAARLAAGQS